MNAKQIDFHTYFFFLVCELLDNYRPETKHLPYSIYLTPNLSFWELRVIILSNQHFFRKALLGKQYLKSCRTDNLQYSTFVLPGKPFPQETDALIASQYKMAFQPFHWRYALCHGIKSCTAHYNVKWLSITVDYCSLFQNTWVHLKVKKIYIYFSLT